MKATRIFDGIDITTVALGPDNIGIPGRFGLSCTKHKKGAMVKGFVDFTPWPTHLKLREFVPPKLQALVTAAAGTPTLSADESRGWTCPSRSSAATSSRTASVSSPRRRRSSCGRTRTGRPRADAEHLNFIRLSAASLQAINMQVDPQLERPAQETGDGLNERYLFVGWVAPIDLLNGSITEAVRTQVSEKKIERHILNYSLLSSNYGALLDLIEVARPGRANMPELDSNVNQMEGWLINNIGADWATATLANQNSKLGIGHGVPPWEEMERMMTRQGVDSVPTHVSRVVRELTSSFYTFS